MHSPKSDRSSCNTSDKPKKGHNCQTSECNMEDEIERLIEQKTGTQAKDPRIKFVSTRNKKAANAIGKKKNTAAKIMQTRIAVMMLPFCDINRIPYGRLPAGCSPRFHVKDTRHLRCKQVHSRYFSANRRWPHRQESRYS